MENRRLASLLVAVISPPSLFVQRWIVSRRSFFLFASSSRRPPLAAAPPPHEERDGGSPYRLFLRHR